MNSYKKKLIYKYIYFRQHYYLYMIEEIYNQITNNYLFLYVLIITVIILSLGLVNKLTCP